MINDTLFFMLIVGIIISAGMLFLFIWAAKTGQFDDSSKMVNGLLFDSVEDLNDAINKEKIAYVLEALSKAKIKGKYYRIYEK